jgi:DNA-binding NarL/FixJ family response regulator
VLHVTGDVDEAERALRTFRPPLAVLVLDPPLRGATVDEACARLINAQPNTATLALLTEPAPDLVRRVCRSGARGVFEIGISRAELHATLRQIDAGEVVVQPSLVRHLLEDRGEETPEEWRAITLNNRELTALQLLARGYTSKQIAPLLDTTAKAIDMTIERSRRRLGAITRAQAVAMAIRRGLIT